MRKLNLHISREQLFLLVYKTLYIAIIVASLCVLQLALNKGAEGYQYVSEEFLRPLCDDIMAYNFFLFGSSLVFIGFFWNLCKVSNQYSSREWIFTPFLNNYLSTPFWKIFYLLHLHFRQTLNIPHIFSTFPHLSTLKSW